MSDWMFQNAYVRVLYVDVKTTAVQLENAINNMAHFGIEVGYNPSKRQMTLWIREPGSLKTAPAGSHSFAEGWLVCRAMVVVENSIDVGVFERPTMSDPQEHGYDSISAEPLDGWVRVELVGRDHSRIKKVRRDEGLVRP
jgi:hypothetical protein